jgi:hypothetical protein
MMKEKSKDEAELENSKYDKDLTSADYSKSGDLGHWRAAFSSHTP